MQYKPSDLDIQSAFSPMKDETREREPKRFMNLYPITELSGARQVNSRNRTFETVLIKDFCRRWW